MSPPDCAVGGSRSSSASRTNISRMLPHLGFDERCVVRHFKALKKTDGPIGT
jgi:hypothetical protein